MGGIRCRGEVENSVWFSFLKAENSAISGKFTHNLDLQIFCPFIPLGVPFLLKGHGAGVRQKPYKIAMLQNSL